MCSNSPPSTGKAKEKKVDQRRLTWSTYTAFIHDAIIQLYVDDELDEYAEFMMTEDFYYGTVSMGDFLRDVATTVVENVVLEKEAGRIRRRKKLVSQEK